MVFFHRQTVAVALIGASGLCVCVSCMTANLATREASIKARFESMGQSYKKLRLIPPDDIYLVYSAASNHMTNLTALKGLPITKLVVTDAHAITNLMPLKGMPLNSLTIRHSHINDLRPLNGMRLTELDLVNTAVTDLSPLRGMQLNSLDLAITYVSDLSPLKGMPFGRRADPKKGIPFTYGYLNLSGCTNVVDLIPLEGMRFGYLNIMNTGVTNVTPLCRMHIGQLLFSPGRIVEGMDLLRQTNSVDSVSADGDARTGMVEFWRKYDKVKANQVAPWESGPPAPLGVIYPEE